MAARWPEHHPHLFPAVISNAGGRNPMTYYSYRNMLITWLAACEVHDEHGRPVHLTPHQWRHTFACRLNLRGIASDASFGSRGERCGSGDLGRSLATQMPWGCHSTRLLSCVDARHHTSRMHWVQR